MRASSFSLNITQFPWKSELLWEVAVYLVFKKGSSEFSTDLSFTYLCISQVRYSLMDCWKAKAVCFWNRQVQDVRGEGNAASRWVPAVCGVISGQQPGGWSIHPFLFLPLPAGARCLLSWENVQLLGLTTDQLLRRCLRFPGLHVDT